MKTCILVMIIGVINILVATAQTISAPSKTDTTHVIRIIDKPYQGQHAPLYIISSHNKQFALDTLFGAQQIDPKWIESINVLVDPKACNTYGRRAKNGVVIITIKEEEYPEAFKDLKRNMKRIKPAKKRTGN
ncbi:hypothetical protein [Mucilaginibacter paludis]|uniref:hypothetical protein n=1 Tax=Mucilaginibacter paludis TaxID=423351 RepID=UPI0001E9CE70|nr:hypothetical protein [Mucilaginibacter paludis]